MLDFGQRGGSPLHRLKVSFAHLIKVSLRLLVTTFDLAFAGLCAVSLAQPLGFYDPVAPFMLAKAPLVLKVTWLF